MAYQKNSDPKKYLLGGVNEKASDYTTQNTQVLNLRNLDFFVPNALSKVPGSTQAITDQIGTSQAVNSIWNYEQLNGTQNLLVGCSGGVYKAVGTSGWAEIGTGWDNGQPLTFRTFLNKAFFCNGQKAGSYDGTTTFSYGMTASNIDLQSEGFGTGMSFFQVFGYTQDTFAGTTVGSRAILYGFFANIRSDGYISPANFDKGGGAIRQLTPATVNFGVSHWVGATSGNYGSNVTIVAKGFSAPSGQNISGHAFFIGLDVFEGLSSNIIEVSSKSGFQPSTKFSAVGSPTDFYLYATYAIGTTIAYIQESTSWDELKATMASYSLMTSPVFQSYVPKYFELNNNRLFSAGFSGAPSTVWFSEVAQPEVIQPSFNFEVRTSDGESIKALKQFQNQLIVFKDSSFHKLIGNSPSNYQLVELSLEYGCISNQAIAEFDNKLVFLDADGIVMYDGADWSIISTPIEPTMRTMNVDAAKETAVAVHYKERNQVWFGIPVSGSATNNLTVIFDYLLNAWTFIDGFDVSAFHSADYGGLNKETTWRGDYNGKVYRHSPSFYANNGNAMTCVIETAFDAPDGLDITSMFRRLFLDSNPAPTGVTSVINVEVLADYDRSTTRATFAVYQDKFQTRSDFGVAAKAIAFKMYQSHVSTPFVVKGYDVHRRFLRKV